MAYSAYDVPGVEKRADGSLYYKGTLLKSSGPNLALYSGEGLRKKVQEIDEAEARANSKAQGANIAESQTKLANEFRSKLPEYTGLLQDQSKKTIQRGLAENIQGLKQKSSSAGFLKGSGTQRQQAEALAGAQTQTMQSDMDIADTMESQAKQFENQALATKMSLQGSANQATIDALKQNILDTQRQTELWKSLGQVVGTGAGYYMANKGTA